MHIVMEDNVSNDTVNRPTALSRKQRELIRQTPQSILATLMDTLLVNSLHSFDEVTSNDSSLIDRVLGIPLNFSSFTISSSHDLSRARIQTTINLVPEISSIIFTQQTHFPLPTILEWHPEIKNKTGIVIFAQDPLPLYGSPRMEILQPALFPEILDDELRIIFSQEFVDAERFDEQSLVAYTDQIDNESQWVSRIGTNPIRIVANAVFGKYPTDPIISSKEANYILASESSSELLSRGRILIIIAPDARKQGGTIHE